ncbi:hypothetical protein F4777DRAFT_192264 [Nemania sp. FL0916]|nr:hypothetical protein F4777DRAFT_192264 [Nemania sp. FL0916]
MSKLPLKIQLTIRDSWESADAPVQKALQNLREILGESVTVNPEWPLLYAELGSFYPDKGTLVPSIAGAVEACCAALGALADDDANAAWADELLERTGGSVRIYVEVSKSRDLSIAWSSRQNARYQTGGLTILLPKSAVPTHSYMYSFFTSHLLTIFSNTQPGPSDNKPPEVEDWADVAVDDKTGAAGVVEVAAPQNAKTATGMGVLVDDDVIPDIDTLARPDDLLLKPPYHLIMHSLGRTSIEIQCSHSPTLQFLCDYLVKWSRTNHANTTKPPCAEVKLHQSAFGLGVVYDRLSITSEGRYIVQTVSPTLILALVEGVLGYLPVSGDGSGTSWTFRRDVGFRGQR